MPAVVPVWLKGALRPWATAKGMILELLRRLSVKCRVGKTCIPLRPAKGGEMEAGEVVDAGLDRTHAVDDVCQARGVA